MPGGDRTGPLGLGPRTGRMLGYCAGYDSPGYTRGIPRGGAGFGYGRGWGRGFGRGFWWRARGFWRREYYPELYSRDIYPAPSREEEKTYLENIVKDLEAELKAVKERLQELSKEKKEVP